MQALAGHGFHDSGIGFCVFVAGRPFGNPQGAGLAGFRHDLGRGQAGGRHLGMPVGGKAFQRGAIFLFPGLFVALFRVSEVIGVFSGDIRDPGVLEETKRQTQRQKALEDERQGI